MFWGLKLAGIKKANKGCLRVKDPTGSCLCLPGVQPNFSTFLWAGERNLNCRTEASLSTYFSNVHPGTPLISWGLGVWRWQPRAGPVLILAGKRQEPFCGRTFCEGFDNLLAVAQCSSAVTIARWVSPVIMVRGFNLFFFPCPLKNMH